MGEVLRIMDYLGHLIGGRRMNSRCCYHLSRQLDEVGYTMIDFLSRPAEGQICAEN